MPGPQHDDVDSYAQVLDAHSQVGQELLARVDGLDEAIRGLNDPIWFVVNHVLGAPQPLQWLGALVNQLLNELADLTHDAVCGRGRPAVKAARTIFELLVAAKDITTGPWPMADRYDRHRWLVWRDAADLEDQTRRGHLSRQETHTRKVSRREVDRNAAAAINDYGAGFRTRWHPESLRERAKNHGLGDDYEWYRLASAVLHGSAGGILGTYIEFRKGPTLHRTGSALALAPDSLTFGLRWARMAFEALTPAIGEITTMMTEAIERIEALVPRFEQVVEDYDHELWQAVEARDLELFVLVTRRGKPLWYIRARMTNWVRPAIEPQFLPTAQKEALERCAEQTRSVLRDGESRSIVVMTDDRRVFPVPGEGWRYSPQMFQQAELRWDAPSERRGFELAPIDDD